MDRKAAEDDVQETYLTLYHRESLAAGQGSSAKLQADLRPPARLDLLVALMRYFPPRQEGPCNVR